MHLSSLARSAPLRPVRLVVLLLALSGCALPGATSPAPPPAAGFVTPGLLTIASDLTYPPQEFLGPGGAITGFDIDLARAIAARLGRGLRVIPTPASDLLPNLTAGRVDAVVSALTTGGERKYVAQFVPYLKVSAAFITTAGSPRHVRRLEDLCGLTVGVLQGSAEGEALPGLSPRGMSCQDRPVRQVVLPVLSAAVDQLRAGCCDVLYVDGPPALALGHARRDLAVTVDGDPVRQAVEAVAVRRKDDTLAKSITTAIEGMTADGSYRTLLARWGLGLEAIDRPADALAS